MTGKVEFTIKQGVAKVADVGQKDPHLTIFDLFGRSTILVRHSCRLVSALGKTGLIDGHNGIRVSQSVEDIGPQFVTDQIFIPHCIGEEALHPIGPGFSCMFSELPTIFARNVAQDALEIQEGTMAWLRTSKTRGNSYMKMT